MRDLGLLVPADSVASNSEAENANALKQMQKILRSDITPSTELNLEQIAQRPL